MEIESELREALDEGTAKSLSVVFTLHATPLPEGTDAGLVRALEMRAKIESFIEVAQNETGETPGLTKIFGAMNSFLVEASPEFIQTLIDQGQDLVEDVCFNFGPN